MRAYVPLAATAGLLFAACAGGPTGAGVSGAGDQPRRIDVEMRSGFAFTPSTISLKPGEKVVIAFKNSDVVEHEFMAGRSATGSVGYKEDLFAGVEHEVAPKPASDHGMGHDATAVGVRLKPGQTGTLSFIVPQRAGEYEFGCFVAGHHESGMKGKLTIQQ